MTEKKDIFSFFKGKQDHVLLCFFLFFFCSRIYQIWIITALPIHHMDGPGVVQSPQRKSPIQRTWVYTKMIRHFRDVTNPKYLRFIPNLIFF